MWQWWVGGAAILLLVVVAIVQFNGMVVRRNRCREAWSNVGTELRRRHELIPNLVRTVQGYAKHERALLAQVTRVRAQASRLRKDPLAQSKTEKQLVALVDRLLAVAEHYPALKASRNFLQLQEELGVTEDRIQASRRFYNGNVRDYHDKIRTFPGFLFAPFFGFRGLPYFQVDSVHLVAPRMPGRW